MELSLATREVAGHTVVEVRGEVDIYTSAQLRERLSAVIDSGSAQVVADLRAVDFLDSSGLGVLSGAQKRLHTAGGELSLVCDRENLLKILRITGMDQLFTVHGTVESATGGSPRG